ncbi:MAG: hypothetical protein EOP45_20435 [Sphingobacteriaceae bacterium]|nr:MAG: hypothetical protein EOP45_20435 [Sphingobacteriaceae bacterium]
MKKLFLAMAVAFISATSFAQENNVTSKKVGFSIGAELASPVGDLKNVSNFGFGGTLQGEYMASDMFGITLNTGYINYFSKYDNGRSVGQIPILAGARYYFIKDIYVSGQLGVSIIKVKGFDSESGFSYAPGIGIKVSVIDLTLKYLGTSLDGGNTSNVGLRVAVNF